MTGADNIKFNKKLCGNEYSTYDNYDAIEVPFVDATPSDYDGVMGVPITFLDKYSPEHFDIVGCSYNYVRPQGWDTNINMSPTIAGKDTYKRLFIRHRKDTTP